MLPFMGPITTGTPSPYIMLGRRGATGAGSHNCQDVAHSVPVKVGDLVDWTITTTGTPVSTALNIAAEIQ